MLSMYTNWVTTGGISCVLFQVFQLFYLNMLKVLTQKGLPNVSVSSWYFLVTQSYAAVTI